MFRVNKKDAVGGDGMTQFGRALHALNIDIICANSSQAKGRVERANGTLQDRLVKEMRLCGIDTIAAGNAFLPAFMEQYNARFAKAPLEDRDVHRPLAGHDDLDDTFAWKEERSVSMNLTLQYDQVLFILEPTGIARSLARKRVRVIDYPDGRLAIRHNGVDLPYRTFDKRPQVNQAAICREQAPWSHPGLHRREAEGARHVPLGQGTTPARPKEPHVQGRIDPNDHPVRRVAQCERLHAPLSSPGKLNPEPTERRLSCSQPSDISNWRKT